MKTIFFAFVLLTFQANYLYANEIDNLKTAEEVNKFLEKKVLAKGEVPILDKKKSDNAPFGKNKFYKLDLNQDGFTDLIVDGFYCLAVTDKGEGKYGFYPIDRGITLSNKYSVTNIISENKFPLIVIRKYDENTKKVGGKETEKTLTFKFDSFIEYNPNPDDLKIEEIKFSTLSCLGNCPVIEITIAQGKTATYNAIKYNDKKGLFKTTIDAATYEKIVQTI